MSVTGTGHRFTPAQAYRAMERSGAAPTIDNLIVIDKDGKLLEAMPLVAEMCWFVKPDIVNDLIAAPLTDAVLARFHGLTEEYVAGYRKGWRGSSVIFPGHEDHDEYLTGWEDGVAANLRCMREVAPCGK